MSLSPHIKKNLKKKHIPSTKELFEKIQLGDRNAISIAITLIESSSPSDFEKSHELLQYCNAHRKPSKRIGITGVPGVGKSTFIESFGLHYINNGHKVAVLAVDPSSSLSKGSILGDKTRMNELSQSNMAFIRPSPTSGTLGGVSSKTRESISILEAAGYDIIIIETVGVGQSETEVYQMTDFFLMLVLAGAGDELQGVKRGIMEMADLIFINKSEPPNDTPAKRAKAQLSQALHLFPPKESHWKPDVIIGSALTKLGQPEAAASIDTFFETQEKSGYLQKHRQEQRITWFKKVFQEVLQSQLMQNEETKTQLELAIEKAKNGNESPYRVAQQVVSEIFRKTF